MTYKQIEASREARLWISQVVIPVATVTTMVLANPEVRTYVTSKYKKTKESIKKKIKKEQGFGSVLFISGTDAKKITPIMR